MSQMSLNVDTEARTLRVVVDGVEMTDVVYVCVNQWDDEPHFSVETMTKDGKKRTCQMISAKLNEDVLKYFDVAN